MIIDTYSKRQNRATQSGKKDVFIYDDLPNPLRVQIVHILRDAIGTYADNSGPLSNYSTPPASNGHWESIQQWLARELGKFRLGSQYQNSYEQTIAFFLEASIESAIDLIELAFRYIDKIIRKQSDYDNNQSYIQMSPDEAITELNTRFLEHKVGYEFLNGIIIRIDSDLLHREVVKESFTLLSAYGFDGASAELTEAFKNHCHGHNKTAISESLKALESTIRTIANRLNWKVPNNATARQLIESVFENELIPSYLQSHFQALRSTLEAGLPTIRNKTSGHGQGESRIELPAHLSAYCLHLASTNIVFLIRAFESQSKSRKRLLRKDDARLN